MSQNSIKNSPWLRGYLQEQDANAVESAIAKAEKRTSGEIVPMVVYRSSTFGHVPVITFGFGVLLYLGIISYWADGIILQSQFGEALRSFLLQPLGFCCFALVWGLVTMFLSRQPWLQRNLTSEYDRKCQAEMRALGEFYQAGLTETAGATGILLFISMVDRQAVVLADEAISEKIPHEVWDELVGILIRSLKKKEMSQGFCEAIARCGEILSTDFPCSKNDVNELKNRLVVKY